MIEIKHLFRFKRLPDNDIKLICLILYLPVGLLALLLRTILAVGVLAIGYSFLDTTQTSKLVNKIFCLAFGISVVVENPEQKEDVQIYVSNNVSLLDHLVVSATIGSVTPSNTKLSTLLGGLGSYYFGNRTNMDNFRLNIISFINENKCPVHFMPEERSTNGRALLKFKSYPFNFDRIQPIAISVERPYLDLSITKLGANYWIDLFYYMFSPLTIYRIKFLPIVEKQNMNEDEFAELVRQNIARALRIETTDYSAEDLNEWEKREITEKSMIRARASVVQYTADIRLMAGQVKDILPYVPLDVICRDIARTKNVENTLNNILEGRVQFVPEQSSKNLTTSQPSTSAASTSHTNKSNLIFPKSSHDRNRSFQERKAQFIADARRRYIEKHHLDL